MIIYSCIHVCELNVFLIFCRKCSWCRGAARQLHQEQPLQWRGGSGKTRKSKDPCCRGSYINRPSSVRWSTGVSRGVQGAGAGERGQDRHGGCWDRGPHHLQRHERLRQAVGARLQQVRSPTSCWVCTVGQRASAVGRRRISLDLLPETSCSG